MSKSAWKLCPFTGLPLSRLERVSEAFLTLEGFVDGSRLFPDCDLFCVNSFAAACGFKDAVYFRDRVLAHPDCPIHYRKRRLVDENTGHLAGEVYATHQNSAVAGGQAWASMQREAARLRALGSLTAPSSLQAI